MMSLDTIHELSAEQASKAAMQGSYPMVITAEDLAFCRRGDYDHVFIPNLGTYCPEDWVRVDMFPTGIDLDTGNDLLSDWPRGWYSGDNEGYGAWFVSKDGITDVDGPALSMAEFFEAITAGYGYAVVEEGQFQVKVGVFRKEGAAS